MEIGRLCVKIAGRDAGNKCVIVEAIDEKFVMIDGETRRRKCNVKHLEPLTETLKIKKGAAHKDIVAEFKKLGIELTDKKPRQKTEKPRQIRVADTKTKASAETAEKKEEPKKAKPVKKEAKPAVK